VLKEKVTTSIRLDKPLKRKLVFVARKERRSLSSLIEIALDEWLELKGRLHPQFMADIKEALDGVLAGEIEDYERR